MNHDSNPSINEYPSVHWEKFFKKFSEIESLPISSWRTVHLLAYFSKLYKNHYGVKFSFKFNANSPSKSFEVFQMRKLAQTISSNSEILKDYIDWFFEHKIIAKKKRITSISFMADTNTANEYKFKKLAMDSSKNIDRSTALPTSVLDAALRLNVNCKTYGDLAFLKKISCDDLDENIKKFLDFISESGLDISILTKVK